MSVVGAVVVLWVGDISSPSSPTSDVRGTLKLSTWVVVGWASAAGSPLGCRTPFPFLPGAGQVYRAS